MKVSDAAVIRFSDMFAALGAEPRLRIVRLLLAAHPDGLVVGEILAGILVGRSGFGWVAGQARSVYRLDQVVSYVNNPNDMIRFEHLGVTAVNSALDRAALLTLVIRNPALYQLLSDRELDKEIREIEVSNPQSAGGTLRDLSLPGDVLVVAVYRQGELIVAHGNTWIEAGDRFTLIGSAEHIETARPIFEQF